MTAGDSESETRPTRRGVLLGVGLAGLGGALAGCSTTAVPYGANEAGAVPGSGSTASAMAGTATGPSSGGAMAAGSGSAGSGSAGMGTSGPGSASMGSAGSGSTGAKGAKRAKAKVTGKVLGSASEIPLRGGKIFTADKVVVTQPARGKYLAFSAVCTHVGCILDKVVNGVIGCPCHGGEFTITTGAVVAGPPPTPLAKKRVKVVDGMVVLL